MAAELVTIALTAGIVLAVVFGIVVVGGFAVIARRRVNHGPDAAIESIRQRANILLVHVDDTVSRAEDELGFAVAQFGDEKTQQFARALADAQQKLREAFSLQQQLDDAYPDTQSQRRDWSARIISLCQDAQQQLDEQIALFEAMRHRESTAPESLAAVLRLIASTAQRRSAVAELHSRLSTDFAPRAVASVADNLDLADAALSEARAAAERAEGAITRHDGTADASISSAEDHARRAEALLTAIETLDEQLQSATTAVEELLAASRANLADARILRDSAPDPDSASAVATAIEGVERALAARSAPADPLETLESLRKANAALDASMAGARNQQRRLDGARDALAGALVQARSQLAATRDFITTRRSNVGATARTRLAESERLLLLAENEADPVAALDLARSSFTHSRDADALARYDLLHR